MNTKQKGIEQKGESGQTFWGMLGWVRKHRPPIVIQENVCGAPWEQMVKYYMQEGYLATYLRVDTKQHYIPHTRTRVYLLAVDTQAHAALPPPILSSILALPSALDTLSAYPLRTCSDILATTHYSPLRLTTGERRPLARQRRGATARTNSRNGGNRSMSCRARLRQRWRCRASAG